MIFGGGKFIAEHILFATLAGGVMIANCADLIEFPFVSMIIGAWAGLWSTACFFFLPTLFAGCKIFDTRGSFFLHGIPGLWGNIASAIIIASMTSQKLYPYTSELYQNSGILGVRAFLYNKDPVVQGGYQIICLLITIGIAVGGGIVSGIILRLWRCVNVPEDTFGDHCFFKMIQEDQVRGMDPKFAMEPIGMVPSVIPPQAPIVY